MIRICKDCVWFDDSYFKARFESEKHFHDTRHLLDYLKKTGFCRFNPPSVPTIEDGYSFPTCDIDDFCSKFKPK
jgi:hypothetical protein